MKAAKNPNENDNKEQALKLSSVKCNIYKSAFYLA